MSALRATAALTCGLGLLGLYRYVDNFWLYRGYPPPKEPSFVAVRGQTEQITVTSPALGGRKQRVLVYLPSGYEQDIHTRYPVLYLLHGVPGRPDQFLRVVRVGIIDDSLAAKHLARPLIVVMPTGSPGLFVDKEWVNGVRPREQWETFVARDLVRAIDARYRTFANGRNRAIAGLSEGGYGALNIATHHPGEFRVVESWSGYERAVDIRAIFGTSRASLNYNSPLERIRHVAAALRKTHTYIWFYSGARDPMRGENENFASALTREGIRHRYLLLSGGHDWRLWRGEAQAAFFAVERGLVRPSK